MEVKGIECDIAYDIQSNYMSRQAVVVFPDAFEEDSAHIATEGDAREEEGSSESDTISHVPHRGSFMSAIEEPGMRNDVSHVLHHHAFTYQLRFTNGVLASHSRNAGPRFMNIGVKLYR